MEEKRAELSPYPWSACHDGECKCGTIFDASGNIYLAQTYGPDDLGDGVGGPDCVPDRESQIANTRAMMCAAEMLVLLEKVATHMDAEIGYLGGNGQDLDPEQVDLLAQVEALCHKARGRTHGKD